MAKTYICIAGDGSQYLALSTQSSGNSTHLVDAGPTLGRIRQYSGYVTGPVLYFVDSGATFGEEKAGSLTLLRDIVLDNIAPRLIDIPAVLVDGGVSATAVMGAELTCTMGNWTGQPSEYAYEWVSNENTVISNTGSTYVTLAEDVDCTVTCFVTATNDAGSTEAPRSNGVFVVAAARVVGTLASTARGKK